MTRAPDPTPSGSPARSSWRARALLFGLFALGTALRGWAVPHARFTGDEAAFWDTARAIAALERFPVLGPEITGSPAHLPGPLFHYVTALPQLFGTSPYWGGAFMGLLHVGAGLLFTRFALDARGPRGALWAAALWAFAPWDVLYGDRVWASCLAPVLGALALFAAHRARVDARWIAVLVATSGLLPQVHLSAPLVWTAAGVLLALRGPRRGLARPALLGLAVVLVAYAPFALGELRSGFAHTRAILAHSGGGASGVEAWLAGARVFGYAWLYATGELGYHFARGYWGGGFDPLAAYGTAAGWAAWARAHGPLLGAAVAVSLGVAALGWLSFLAGVGRAALRARRVVSADTAMGLAILAGLAAGAVLLVVANKAFYPHYANVLVPFALWPAASGLDRAYAALGRGLRALLVGAFLVALAGMTANTVRYYQEVDALNGLRTTSILVERVLAEDGPVDVRFTHYRNGYAWRKLAAGHFGQPLELDPSAPVRFTVHNHTRARRGEAAARLERARRAPDPPDAAWIASRDAEAVRVRVAGAPGLEGCEASGGPCRYGAEPWQRLEPETLRFGGRLERVWFMHPVSGATVSASFAPPSGGRLVLRYGLTDAALRSANRAPVLVGLREGARRLLRARTSTAPGLLTREVRLRGDAPVTVELFTVDDGARVTGFDLWLVSD